MTLSKLFSSVVPTDILGKFRWAFLLLTIITVALNVVPVATAAATAWSVRLAVSVGILWLCWHWIVAYRRGRLAVPWSVAEASVFFLAGAANVDQVVFTLVYPSLMLRAFYAENFRNVCVVTSIYLMAIVGAVLVWGSGTGSLPVEILSNFIVAPVVAVMVHFLARVLTRYEQAERALAYAEEQYRKLVEQVPVTIYLEKIKVPGVEPYISPQVEALLGYTPRELLADPGLWKSLIHPEDRESLSGRDDLADDEGKRASAEYRVISRDGRTVWVRDESAPVCDTDGNIRFWQGVMSDITAQKDLEYRLSYQAFHDSLTGLPNRALFKDRLEHALARTDRSKRSLAVLFLDLDNFKYVNDTLGHENGDLLLVEVSRRLKKCMRPADTLARLGGDEFIVLLEDVESEPEVIRVVERVSENMGLPVLIGGQEILAKASMGIAFGSSEESGENLMRNADTAMYEAKKSSEVRYRIFGSAVKDPGSRPHDGTGDRAGCLA